LIEPRMMPLATPPLCDEEGDQRRQQGIRHEAKATSKAVVVLEKGTG